MEKDDPLLTAMFEMCNRKNPLNDGQREWSIADLPGLLREGCYDELEARYSRALAESLTSREAEKRYFLAWTQMCNHFYDMDALVEAGPAGLALIKNWQRARPRSSYAWLAEAQYWNHRAWLYRSYGWAQDTTRAMWICASACNERMVIAALYAIDLEPRQWMAASLTSTNSKVFGQPDWLAEFLAGAEVAGRPLMQERAEYHRRSPQEVEALMAHSGLSFADAVCPNLPRPQVLPACDGDAGQRYWLAVCLAIFPTAFYALDEYIPFRMPRWGGSHQEIREFLASTVCDHLTAAEREHLELLIWWDDHRDLRINEVDSPTEREHIIAKAEEIARRAHMAQSRHHALEWLLLCYSDLDDKDALWLTLQRSVMEKVKLNNYYTAWALKFALRDFPDSEWIYNFICQNAQQTEYGVPKIYRGYFQYAGLFGFEKDEAQGAVWLDSVADIEYDHNWRAAIKDFRWLGYPEYLLPLAHLGARRNIPSALNQLGVESNARDNGGLLPYDPAIAFGYCQQAAEILRQHVAQRDADNKYRLIANGGDDGYEQDLQEIHFRMANCCERLINQAPPAEKRAAYEKNLLDNLYLASRYGDKRAWELFLLNIAGVKDLALAHSHLQQVQEAANKGSPEAMVALSQLYGNKRDKALYNMKQSARWAHFFITLYPEHELFMDLDALHFDSFWKRWRFAWYTSRIPDSELPGQVNSMV